MSLLYTFHKILRSWIIITFKTEPLVSQAELEVSLQEAQALAASKEQALEQRSEAVAEAKALKDTLEAAEARASSVASQAEVAVKARQAAEDS